MSGNDNEDLIDYEDEHDAVPNGASASATNGAAASGAGDGEGGAGKNFSGVHSTGFRSVPFDCRLFSLTDKAFFLSFSVNRDFLLKPELRRAISDLGFEHPSEGN